MDEPEVAVDLQALVSESAWLERLALRLIGDAHLAEDVAQEARLRAWQAERAPTKSWTAWISGTARNLARETRRDRERRVVRERRSARSESLENEDTLERLESQTLLGQSVLALREPYRGTILMRFFEGMRPAEIAARSGVPVATVQSRITRALALLRSELERGCDGERDWLAALAPLCVGPWSSAALAPLEHGGLANTLGAWTMKQKVMGAVLGVAVLIGSVGVAWSTSLMRSSGAGGREVELVRPQTTPSVTRVAVPTGSTRRSVAAEGAPGPVFGPQDSVEIQVVDGDSREPVEGAEVYALSSSEWFHLSTEGSVGRPQPSWEDFQSFAESHELAGSSDADGRLTLAGVGAETFVFARFEDRTGTGFNLREDPIVPLHGSHSIEVRVIDGRGRPVGSVPVALLDRAASVSIPLGSARTADPNGRALLRWWDGFGAMRPRDLAVALGFPSGLERSVSVDPDRWPSAPVTLELPTTGAVSVEVLGPEGELAPDGTVVTLGSIPAVPPAGWQGGSAQQMLMARTEDGRVHFAPVEVGCEVAVAVRWFPEAPQQPFVQLAPGPRHPGAVEQVSVRVRGRLVHVRGHLVAEPDSELPSVVACLKASREDPSPWSSLEIDDQGAFELADVIYEGEAAPAWFVLFVASEEREFPLPAPGHGDVIDLGSIEVAPGKVFKTIRGVVVDARGEPRSGVAVSAGRPNLDADDPSAPLIPMSRNAVTDPRGRFELQGSFEGELWLQAQGRQGEIHRPIPMQEETAEYRLVLESAAVLRGVLLCDPGIPAAKIRVQAWPAARGPTPGVGVHGWLYAQVDGDGRFEIGPLQDGDYTVRVVLGTDVESIDVEHVRVRTGVADPDPRLDPIDLRGMLAFVDVVAYGEAGEPVDAVVYWLRERRDGGTDAAPIGNANQGPFVFDSGVGGHLIVQAEGYFPQWLPLRDEIGQLGGRREVRLRSGLEVTLLCPQAGELTSDGQRFELALRPVARARDTGGGELVQRYLTRWAPDRGEFSQQGRARVRVPTAGTYRLEWRFSEHSDGSRRTTSLASDATLVIEGEAAPHEVSLPRLPNSVLERIDTPGAR